MLSLALNCLWAFSLTLTSSVNAQQQQPTTEEASLTSTNPSDPSSSGYVGYNLTLEGDQDSVIFATENTRPEETTNRTYPDPDVFLNASVSVEEINIEVDELTAKVNLDLQILQLLQFNAGVDLSVDKIQLLIQNVSAKVLLEARLENLVAMVDDVLESLDLNPVIATLGQGVSDIVDETADATGEILNGDGGDSSDSDSSGEDSSSSSSSSASSKRSPAPATAILYSITDFSGSTHTNFLLTQRGEILSQDLDNFGRVSRSRVTGSYAADMAFTGHEEVVEFEGESVLGRRYKYEPIVGVEAVVEVFFEEEGDREGGDGEGEGVVVGTRILSELEAGGWATVVADGE